MAELSAIQAADYLIQKAIEDDSGDLLTNLKLQKMLYYAQGCFLAIYGEPLFNDTVEAWDLGPVCPAVYHSFKVCGRQPIEETFSDEVAIDRRFAEFLDIINEKFGGFSASRLVAMTHDEEPWRKSYASGLNNEIDKDKIKEFFKSAWIDPDVDVEDDGYESDLIEALSQSSIEAASLEPVSAEEMVRWLEDA